MSKTTEVRLKPKSIEEQGKMESKPPRHNLGT